MTTPSSGWFNDVDFSDLTLKLSDDREIKVHKLVICKQNEYFRKLCGPTSSFKEAKQSVITLRDDNADAVEEVLRKIYGCTLPAAHERGWRFWFALITIADKYLEPELSAKSDENFRKIALGWSNVDVVFDIFQAIKAEMSHTEPLLAFADVLRKQNLKNLLKHDGYRELLAGDKDLLLAQLDEIEEGLEDPEKANKRQYSLCSSHAPLVFSPPEPAMRKCSLCPVDKFGFGQYPLLVRGIADVPPAKKPT